MRFQRQRLCHAATELPLDDKVVGVNADSGVVHSLETSTANVQDCQVCDEMLHGEEPSIWADKGYVSAEREAALNWPHFRPDTWA